MKNLIALLIAWAGIVCGQVSITANSPSFGWQTLPGSVRRINVGITNGTLKTVNWSVLSTVGGGSASLSCSNACLPTIDVTIGSQAGNCSFTGVLGSYAVSSTVSVVVQAQSVDDNSKTTTFNFNVCQNTITMAVVPFYRTLYKTQQALLQSYVIGYVNQDVTWSITSSPMGGNGTLADTGNHDALFTAGTVTGRYTLQALSNADGVSIATAIMYVSPNTLPYSVTQQGTEPVDCSVDPALSGTTYTVGAGKTYPDLSTVPLNTNPSGSTVQVYNTDNTGLSPSTYHNYIQIGLAHTGSASQPIRIVGCPDSLGNLPILDANNSTAGSWVCTNACAGFGAVTIWPGNSFGLYQTGNNLANYIIVEGLHIKNAQTNSTFTPPAGPGTVNTSGTAVTWVSGFTFSLGLFGGWSSGDTIVVNNSPFLISSVNSSTSITLQSSAGNQTGVTYQPPWVTGASCMNIRGGYQLVILGNVFESCSNGTFADSNTNNNGWQGNVFWTDWEGNNLYNDGNIHTGFSQHQLYIQGWGQLIQFNQSHDPFPGMQGAMLKTRGLGDVIRYNWIGVNTASERDIDMIDIQDASFYETFEGYLTNGIPTAKAPTATGSNLAVDASNNLKVTSATHTFTSADGSCIGISSGTGWTPGDYKVSSFTGGAAILNSSPAAVNTTGGVWAIGAQAFKCQGDTMGPNVLSAWQEAFHYHWIYGNVFTNPINSSAFLIHFGYDHDAGMSARLGNLYLYNNTIYPNYKGDLTVVDDAGAGGTNFNVYEFQKGIVQNNIVWMPNACTPPFSSNNSCAYVSHLSTFIGTYATNMWGTSAIQTSTPVNGGVIGNQTGSGWSSATTAFSYPLSVPIDPHSTGISSPNFITSSSAPFDTVTFRPINIQAGTALSGIMAKMPVRFEYQPNLGYAIPRETPVTGSNGDVVGAFSNGMATSTQPTFSPLPGSYVGSQSIVFSTVTPGATMCYRTDGMAPTASTPGTCDSPATTYTTAPVISVSTTFRAITTKVGYNNSSVATGAYIISSGGGGAVGTSVGGGISPGE